MALRGARRAAKLRGNSRLEKLRLTAGQTPEALAAELRQNPLVELVEPNYLISRDELVPDDTRFNEQWALRNTGSTGGLPNSDITAPMAWETTTGARSAVIAVIDSGIDFTHPDLINNQWTNSAESANGSDDDHNGLTDDLHGWNWIANSGNVRDEQGHGTLVAGVIASEGNNGMGTSGVMWRASLMSLRVLDANGIGDVAAAVEAIDYAATHGAQVINCSWGTDEESVTLRDAIERAGRSGAVVVVSAGNSGRDIESEPYYPASFGLPNVIAVAATNNFDQLTSWSNYGSAHVAVAAPGTDILTTEMGGGYRSVTGTSVAAPLVSGVAGLVRTVRPWLTPNGTVAAIKDGARHIAELSGKVSTSKVVSAYGALNALQGSGGSGEGGGDSVGSGGNTGGQGGSTPPFTPPAGGGGSGTSTQNLGVQGTPGPNLPNLDRIRTTTPPAPRVPATIQADLCTACDGGGDPGGDSSSPSDPYYATARTRPQNETGQAGVDLGSRNFNWSTPLVAMPGRAGLNLDVSLYYNSLIWTKYNNSIMFNADRGTPAPGFQLGFPTLEPQYMDADENYASYLLVMPSGGHIQLKPTGTANVFESSDSSYIQLTANGTNTGGTARTIDGTQYKFVMQADARMHCTQIKDRNGNFITINYNTSTGQLASVIDTLGRSISFHYTNDLLSSITQTRNGVEYELVHLSYAPLTIDTNFPGMSYRGPLNPIPSMLKRIAFDDGSSYRFDYTTWGQIYKISHHGTDDHLRSYTKYNLPLTKYDMAASDCPRFTERRDWAEYWNGDADASPAAGEEAVTSYSVDPNSASGEQPAWNRVTLPDGTVYKEYFATQGWQKGLTTESRNFATVADEQADTEQTPKWKKRTVTGWTHDGTGIDYQINPRPAETKIYDSDGNLRRTTVDYTLYGLPQDVKEYGGADGATLLRQTHTGYLIYSPEYISRHILNLVQFRELWDTTGHVVAKEDFVYDQGGEFMSSPGVPVQHDEQDYGASFVSGRGNLCYARRWDVNQLGDVTQALSQQIGYNTVGEVTFTRDMRGHRTDISYADSFKDGLNRNTYAFPTRGTNPDGSVSTSKYDYNLGVVTDTEGPPPAGFTQGATAEMEYDSAGRLLKVTNKINNAYTSYVYGSFYVQSFSSVNAVANDSYSIQLFDGVGRVRATAAYHPGSTGGYTAQYTTFDVMGRVSKQSNPAEIDVNWNAIGDDAAGWYWTQQAYDWKGRPTTTTNPDSSTRTTSYGGCGCAGGEVVTVKDEAGRGRRLSHDVLGRLTKIEELRFDGSVYSNTTYDYDESDKLKAINQQGSAPRTFEYDGYGRLSAKTTPEQGRTTYSYYTDNTINTVTDARGVGTTYTYNNRHLLTAINYNVPQGAGEQTPGMTFAYDAAGNRTQMDDGPGLVTYSYDRLSQLKSETRTFDELSGSSFSLSYAYNVAGQLTKVTNPWGVEAGYQYDNEGRVRAVSGANYGGVASYINNISYRAFGGAKSIAYGNGKSLSLGYDQRLRLKKWDLTGVLGYDYSYNSYAENTGRVTFADSIYDPTLDRSYVYDFVGRVSLAYTGSEARATIGLDTWGHPDGPYAQGFEYDLPGNMTRGYGWGGWYGSSADRQLTYENNRLMTNPTTGAALGYDAAGNVTSEGALSFKYDATGQQVSASAMALTQGYDGYGMRVKKTENTQNTYYVRSSVLGGQVLAEVSRDNGYVQWMRGYVYLGGQLLAIQDGAVLWMHQEPITKGQRLTDTTGNVVSAIEVDPFGGETFRMANQWRQPHRYTSYERDANGGDEAMYRRYEGRWQRFNQPDPYDGSYDLGNPQSFNRYTYVENDPVNFVDPTGLMPCNPGDRSIECGWSSVSAGFWGWGSLIDRPRNTGRRVIQEREVQLWRSQERWTPGGFIWFPMFADPQNPVQRNPSDIKRDFYKQYGQKLNDCIKQVFGTDAAKVGRQTLRDAPVLNARLNSTQVGAISGVATAIGSSDPFKGRYGTVYVASEVFNGNTPNTLNAIYGTFVHELGNVLDIRLNPNVSAAQYGRTYGNPNDPDDTDTGAALENCVFGSLQYP